jgi:hypothetical protein
LNQSPLLRRELFDARPAPPSGSRRRDRVCLPVDAPHAEIFDIKELLDAVFRAFAADAALLNTAERRDLGRDDALIDTAMPYSSPSATRRIRPMSRP